MEFKQFVQVSFALVVTAYTQFSCTHPLPTTPDENPGPSDTLVVDEACDPNAIYFVNEVLPIFSSSCALPECHSNSTKVHGIDLSSYDALFTGDEDDLVVSGNPEKSEVYDVILDGEMPPSGYPALTSTEMQSIYSWIDQGALNNECSSCDTSAFKFASNINPIIVKNCVSCHNGPSGNKGVDLSSYSSIKVYADNGLLKNSILAENGVMQMPTTGRMPDCEVNKLLKWIEAGSPND